MNIKDVSGAAYEWLMWLARATGRGIVWLYDRIINLHAEFPAPAFWTWVAILIASRFF